MKVVLAGAGGHLGRDLLRALLRDGHEVVAIDLGEKGPDVGGRYVYRKADVTDKASLKGLCDGADCVVSTVGLTKVSATLTNEQIDYQGNRNLLEEAKSAGVKHFGYVSVLKAGEAPDVPMLDAKYRFEQELKASGLHYAIFRPTGYFYDIVKVFQPMVEKGTVTLLGKKPVHANVIATEDLADFIALHLMDENKTYDIGGTETYSYEEIAAMCFEAAGKPLKIKHAPAFLFDLLAAVNRPRHNGKEAILKFSKWTLTQEMVGSVQFGTRSFRQYIRDNFQPSEKKVN
jgi:uncharacterized protein YbjT (DUF2867 family)